MSEDQLEELESAIIEKLIANGALGVTRFDFPEYPDLTEEIMESVIGGIERLMHIDAGGVLQ